MLFSTSPLALMGKLTEFIFSHTIREPGPPLRQRAMAEYLSALWPIDELGRCTTIARDTEHSTQTS